MVREREGEITELQKTRQGTCSKTKGIGLDLRASFPAIVTGLVGEIVKERGAHIDMTETQKMIRDLKAGDAKLL